MPANAIFEPPTTADKAYSSLKSSPDNNPPLANSRTAPRHIDAKLSCEMRNGVPVIRGVSSSYYLFDQSGKRLLILTRKERESIVVNDTIDIVILEIAPNHIKFGIVCPVGTVVRCKDNDSAKAAPQSCAE